MISARIRGRQLSLHSVTRGLPAGRRSCWVLDDSRLVGAFFAFGFLNASLACGAGALLGALSRCSVCCSGRTSQIVLRFFDMGWEASSSLEGC